MFDSFRVRAVRIIVTSMQMITRVHQNDSTNHMIGVNPAIVKLSAAVMIPMKEQMSNGISIQL